MQTSTMGSKAISIVNSFVGNQTAVAGSGGSLGMEGLPTALIKPPFIMLN